MLHHCTNSDEVKVHKVAVRIDFYPEGLRNKQLEPVLCWVVFSLLWKKRKRKTSQAGAEMISCEKPEIGKLCLGQSNHTNGDSLWCGFLLCKKCRRQNLWTFVERIFIRIRVTLRLGKATFELAKAPFYILLHWSSASAQLPRKMVQYASLGLWVDVIAHLPCRVMRGGHLE